MERKLVKEEKIYRGNNAFLEALVRLHNLQQCFKIQSATMETFKSKKEEGCRLTVTY